MRARALVRLRFVGGPRDGEEVRWHSLPPPPRYSFARLPAGHPEGGEFPPPVPPGSDDYLLMRVERGVATYEPMRRHARERPS